MLLKSQQKLKFHRKYLGIWIKITQIILQNLNSNLIKLNFQVDSARFGGRVRCFFTLGWGQFNYILHVMFTSYGTIACMWLKSKFSTFQDFNPFLFLFQKNL